MIDNDHEFFNSFVAENIIGKSWKVLREEGAVPHAQQSRAKD